MGDDNEWMKLPIDQKCEHKVGNLCLWVWLDAYLCSGDSVVLLFTAADHAYNRSETLSVLSNLEDEEHLLRGI